MSALPHRSLRARARSALQHVYPKRLLSALMFRATRVRFAAYKNWQIRWFIRRYGVNMDEALEANPLAYPEFNTFFTRPLSPEARPVTADAHAISSPADGTVLELGRITSGRLLQVKGLELDVAELLGHRTDLAEEFSKGSFATVYLSPRDYHRVHMPYAGDLRVMGHMPGELFSVSLDCVHNIPRLLARNERVVSVFDTPIGAMAVILVGAVFVGCIETVWAGPVLGGASKQTTWTDYRHDASTAVLAFERGQEMGRFNMGSTVITLFANPDIRWDTAMQTGRPVTMGEAMGRLD